ncbi:MAG: NUDIX hydrolase [Magnetococcales bacterium]|nr:NUDIX hydrolase [Magnetococcales bacterium]
MSEKQVHSVLSTTIEYQNDFLEVVAKRATGYPTDTPFYALSCADYIGIIALDPDDQILLVRQYRPVVEDYTLELPGGTLEPGEDPAVCARRELLEETGHRAVSLDLMGTLITDTGRMTNRLWCFMARVEKADQPASPTADEPSLQWLSMHYQTFLDDYVSTGRFRPALNYSVLLLALLQNRFQQPVQECGS